MKKLLSVFTFFCCLSLCGQNINDILDSKDTGIHPPPGPGDINAQPPNDKIFYKVDKKIGFKTQNLSDSFDYSIIDAENKPTENIFIVSFVSEVHKNISNLKIEVGKDPEVTRELKRMLLRAHFYPATVNGWFVRSYCKLKFIFDYENSSMEVIIL